MMRMLTFVLCSVFIAAAAGVPTVAAQAPVEDDPHLINQFLADRELPRSSVWWNALGRQLTLMVDKPADQVAPVSLQNIIFFANTFPTKVDLEDAAPELLRIYREHPDPAMRVMALAALDAVGVDAFVEAAYRVSLRDGSPLARRLARASMSRRGQ